MPQISYDDFGKWTSGWGRIVQVDDFPEGGASRIQAAHRFRELGLKTSAPRSHTLRKEELQQRLVIAVVNFPPRQIADFFSEVLSSA